LQTYAKYFTCVKQIKDIYLAMNISPTELPELVSIIEKSDCSNALKDSAHLTYQIDLLKKQNNEADIDFWEDYRFF
jgi:hypothetical protein